jgi:hypothetical protein
MDFSGYAVNVKQSSLLAFDCTNFLYTLLTSTKRAWQSEDAVPAGKVPNMLAKYYTTTQGLEMAKK